MNEAHFGEIERLLFNMSGARRRAEKLAADLVKGGADQDLIDAVAQVERDLEAAIDRLFKGTYFAVPREQLTLSD